MALRHALPFRAAPRYDARAVADGVVVGVDRRLEPVLQARRSPSGLA